MSRRYDLASVGRGLRLWSCAVGDPGEIGDHWVLLWARDEQRARALAIELRGERGDEPEHVYVTEADADGARPLGAEHHEEEREWVMRAAGWHADPGSVCDECGLHDLDAERWAVCPWCNRCAVCGHDSHPDYACASDHDTCARGRRDPSAREHGEDPLLPSVWRSEETWQTRGWALAQIAAGQWFAPTVASAVVAALRYAWRAGGRA